jgi:hypothetical protein
MPRADLLALTADDLIALTNRGVVKRAQKELEGGEPKCEIAEDETGGVTVAWSDGITCRFLADKTVHDAVCSSGVLGISRHIIRSVLAYQRDLRDVSAKPDPGDADSAEAPPAATEAPAVVDQAATVPAARPGDVWDPGQITDETLITCFKKQVVARARARFDQGVLVELTRGAKPTARFLDEACTVRFAVPGDPRYASADCAEALWPTWAALAVWAFRELPAGQLAGLVSLQRTAPPVPSELFGKLRGLLDELCRDGLGNVAPTWSERLTRAEEQLRAEGLVWLAELVLEIVQQHEMYRQHDARFDPDQVVLDVGELLARMAAIERGVTPVPQLLIRGTKSERPTDLGTSRFAGVGLGVDVGRRHVTLRAFLQETNTGTVVAVARTFPDPDPASGTSPRPFAELAATVLVRGASLGGLATSQLLIQSGKRTPSGQLVMPRLTSTVTVHPQSFQWEQLKPPYAVESFAQLRARLRFLPPSYLRPRRSTENLHGCAVASVKDVQFDHARQQLTATMLDTQGETATLVQPFHSRGAAGFSALSETLTTRGDQVRFVSGHVRASHQGLVLQPALLIVDDGSRRVGVTPWTPNRSATDESADDAADARTPRMPRSEIQLFLNELQQSLSDVLLTGLVRDAGHARIMGERTEQSRRLGFVHLAQAISQFAETLAARSGVLRWEPAAAVRHFQDLCVMVRVAAE